MVPPPPFANSICELSKMLRIIMPVFLLKPAEYTRGRFLSTRLFLRIALENFARKKMGPVDSREDSYLALAGCEPVLPACRNASVRPRDQKDWLVLCSATMEAVVVKGAWLWTRRTKTAGELEARSHRQQTQPAIDWTPRQSSTIERPGLCYGAIL